MSSRLTASGDVVERFIRPLYAGEGPRWPASSEPLDEAALAALKQTKAAYTVLHAWDAGGLPTAPEARAELGRLRRREAILDQELAAASGALTGAAVEHVLLRGHALGARYPAGHVRQYNDVDLLIRDGRALPRALSALRHLGYYTARPIVSRRDRAGLWAGVALNRRAEGLGHPMYLDLTTLGPGLDRASALPLPAWAWAKVGSLKVAGVPVPVLDTTWQAVVFAVELVERCGDFLHRDLLDLLALDRCEIDWNAVGDVLAETPEASAALAELALIAGAAGAPLRGEPASRVQQHQRPGARLRCRRAASTVLDRGIARLRKRSPRGARRLVELFPTRLWSALGLPVFLLPPAPGYGTRGSAVSRAAGLADHRVLVYPLVRPGYSQAAFAPPAEEQT